MLSLEDLYILQDTDISAFRDALPLLPPNEINARLPGFARGNLLHGACAGGKILIVRELLAGVGAQVGFRGVNVEERGFSALHFAALNGRSEIVRELLREGGSGRKAGFSLVTEENRNGETALSLAAENGEAECIRAIFEHCTEEELGKLIRWRRNDDNILMRAIGGGVATTSALLDCMRERKEDLLSLLGDNEYIIRKRSNNNGETARTTSTALHRAAFWGHHEIVRCLIRYLHQNFCCVEATGAIAAAIEEKEEEEEEEKRAETRENNNNNNNPTPSSPAYRFDLSKYINQVDENGWTALMISIMGTPLLVTPWEQFLTAACLLAPFSTCVESEQIEQERQYFHDNNIDANANTHRAPLSLEASSFDGGIDANARLQPPSTTTEPKGFGISKNSLFSLL